MRSLFYTIDPIGAIGAAEILSFHPHGLAYDARAMSPKLKLGELLVQNGLITNEQLEMGLQAQRIYGGKLGTNLVELGLLSDKRLAEFLAKQLEMESASPDEFERISKDVISLMPTKMVEEHRLIPVSFEKNRLRVAISDPYALSVIDQLSFKIGKPIHPVIAPEVWIVAALERYYNIPRQVRYIPIADDADSGNMLITNLTGQEVSLGSSSKQTSQQPLELNEVVEEVSPLHDYIERLLKATTKEEVLDALLDYLGPLFPRMAVFVIVKDQIRGWVVRGFPVYAREFSKSVIGVGQGSLLDQIVSSNVTYRGPVMDSAVNQKLFGMLKLPPNRPIEIHPILFQGKVVMALLALPDDQYDTTKPIAGNLVGSVCEKAGSALEILALQHHIRKPPSMRARDQQRSN